MFSFFSKNILKLLLCFFFIWLIFFDENAFFRQIKINSEIKNQKKEISRLKELIITDSILIKALSSDTLSQELEKILRENYLFSKENEIIYKIEE
tara:strand:- start:558 stop:842 length:285 start_codon:yes stop_codon:yes gene_type:complete